MGTGMADGGRQPRDHRPMAGCRTIPQHTHKPMASCRRPLPQPDTRRTRLSDQAWRSCPPRRSCRARGPLHSPCRPARTGGAPPRTLSPRAAAALLQLHVLSSVRHHLAAAGLALACHTHTACAALCGAEPAAPHTPRCRRRVVRLQGSTLPAMIAPVAPGLPRRRSCS